ncbi:SGNH/GDSL hydrolase family protein [Mucilaginibacter glaciei]|uniref:SGNH/GDSL hydrolase family protein n=1 Tax=Mucilaginibacter glaciei TaxID=2772109 RepID=A0A926NG64_9SPHI|nr:SGNH/GDSL hydrolase family protein [Mucilaginibacter glaciei]MBD1391499.1 SGNH/GDSL hydrolase family protein [Mucilaginibacter glaciei]
MSLKQISKIIGSLVLIVVLFASCNKGERVIAAQPVFTKILILGNSITFAPTDPNLGWNCACGMAASKPDSDYVHLLTRNFKAIDQKNTVAAKNIAAFERGFLTYDFDAELKVLRDERPDLIIIRIGENVQQDNFDATAFGKRYEDLIAYFKMGNEKVTILAVGSFWGNDAVDAIMKKHSEFITLKPLGLDMSNYAWGLFPDHGVQSHPGDKGMRTIGNTIWAKIQTMPASQ